MKPDLKYVPSNEWKKKDLHTAIADDGSSVWIDKRGFLGYERPDSYYISCGIDLHDSSKITLYKAEKLELEEDGASTGHILESDLTGKFYDSIARAVKELGYEVEFVKNNS